MTVIIWGFPKSMFLLWEILEAALLETILLDIYTH